MTGLGQSSFLQALGWATLSSFWQMGLLWCGFVATTYVFKPTARQKFLFSSSALILGLLWFIATFIAHYQLVSFTELAFYNDVIIDGKTYLPVLLNAASIAYLGLLVIPIYRFFISWKYAQRIRTTGLQKPDVHYRLYIRWISEQLGIRNKVQVYVSHLVKSPVTVGFIKPLILLPVACINNLSIQQVEAVLLHELSHIKRFDYLVNILVAAIHTLLYFNPFTKLFTQVIETERENCCDELVLQFGYDKVSYASALLSLEKLARNTQIFAIGAAGKKNLLYRIEKIVGMENKSTPKANHWGSLIAAILCIFVLNSILIGSKNQQQSLSFTAWANPFYFISEPQPETKAVPQKETPVTSSKNTASFKKQASIIETVIEEQFIEEQPNTNLLQVVYEEGKELTEEQKAQVKSTVETTKSVLGKAKWSEIENTIADGLTEDEKLVAKEHYLNEVKNINWAELERNLSLQYERLNWDKINASLKNASATVQFDSLQNAYEQILQQIENAETALKSDSVSTENLPMPDESVTKIHELKNELLKNIKQLKELKRKNIVNL